MYPLLLNVKDVVVVSVSVDDDVDLRMPQILLQLRMPLLKRMLADQKNQVDCHCQK
jgi:hypothetical protein